MSDTPCHMQIQHAAHAWDTTDRVVLRLHCPGRTQDAPEPEPEPMRSDLTLREAATLAAVQAMHPTFDMQDSCDDWMLDNAQSVADAVLTAAADHPGLADELHGQWETFQRHHPTGAYLPTGHLAGDCRQCGTAWPCPPALDVLRAWIRGQG